MTSWVPWQDGKTGLFHAARTEGGRDKVFVFDNIGFEDRADCVAYIAQADPEELGRLATREVTYRPRRVHTSDAIEEHRRKRKRMQNGKPDDPRFEWVQIQTFSDPKPRWIKGPCNHLTPAPVDLRTGELVAWWCPDCGEQFERDRWPVPEHLWVPLPEVRRVPGTHLSREVFDDRYADRLTVLHPNGYERWAYGSRSMAAVIKREVDEREPFLIRTATQAIDLFKAPWYVIKTTATGMLFSLPVWVWIIWCVGYMLGWWNG